MIVDAKPFSEVRWLPDYDYGGATVIVTQRCYGKDKNALHCWRLIKS